MITLTIHEISKNIPISTTVLIEKVGGAELSAIGIGDIVVINVSRLIKNPKIIRACPPSFTT